MDKARPSSRAWLLLGRSDAEAPPSSFVDGGGGSQPALAICGVRASGYSAIGMPPDLNAPAPARAPTGDVDGLVQPLHGRVDLDGDREDGGRCAWTSLDVLAHVGSAMSDEPRDVSDPNYKTMQKVNLRLSRSGSGSAGRSRRGGTSVPTSSHVQCKSPHTHVLRVCTKFSLRYSVRLLRLYSTRPLLYAMSLSEIRWVSGLLVLVVGLLSLLTLTPVRRLRCSMRLLLRSAVGGEGEIKEPELQSAPLPDTAER